MEKKIQKNNLFIRFLTYFDCNSIPVEFGVKRRYKSSFISIIVTYSWIIGAIIMLNYIGTFAYGNKIYFFQKIT
jgi:hypothetical protein